MDQCRGKVLGNQYELDRGAANEYRLVCTRLQHLARASLKKSLIFKQNLQAIRRHGASALSKRQSRRIEISGKVRRRHPSVRTYPSFVGLKPASQLSSLSKKANKSQGTKHEVLLQRALRRRGFHFRRNVSSLPGKPDLVFPLEKLAVFCDGDFWHGRKWRILQGRLSVGSNGKYWTSKIGANIKHDKFINHLLRSMGYKVLRIWESDIKAGCDGVSRTIADFVERNQGGSSK